MNVFRQGLSLALLGAGLAAVPLSSAATASAAPAPAEKSMVQRMKDDAQGTAKVSTERATGRVGFARATDLLPSVQADSKSSAAAKATAYLDEYATAFGARPTELEQVDARSTAGGWTIEYAQSYQGVPVFAGQLQAHVDTQGDLTSVNGFAVPELDVSVTPRLSQDEATSRAVALVRDAPKGSRVLPSDAKDLKAASTQLMIYRLGTTRGVEGAPLLTWVVEVTNESNVRETVILDATTGKAVNRWSMLAHALDRELYEKALAPASLVWSEGDEFPGELDEDQASEVLGTGEAYWMFMNTFGRDSYDGEGATMITVNNDPSIRCPNANWNGTSTNYCSGVSSDDTVAHEWGHAYTEYTSGLIYQWQSGAMNEAYSDIWGETVDMLNDRMNESETEPRTEGDCSIYSPERASITLVAPEEVAGRCPTVKAVGGPDFPTTPTDVTIVAGLDAVEEADGEPAGTANDGCSPFDNADEIAGNWVYVEEADISGCLTGTYADSYDVQQQNAIDAGAVGLILSSVEPWEMPSNTFEIPAAQIDAASGDRIKSVEGPVTAQVSQTTNDADSHRWLSGESDPAFGGAIRDMWNPTCYGDPGKVSDEEYYCDTADNGGVHTNSGVVNHTYALLVDGSTSNGVTVPAIGLDKAANLFWRTQSEYLTPTSDFADLADGLAASCADLVGQDIKAVTLGTGPTGGGEADAPAAEAITTDDCAAVDAAAQATELRVEPVQCNFQPILDKNTPSLCGAGFRTEVAFQEDFEDGLAGWTQDEDVVYEGASGTPWRASSAAPGGHAGGVAFAPDPATGGSCNLDADDLSARNGLISPAMTYPAGTAPTLSFDHYVATESGWDGGNVKVSVKGAPFTLVPTEAYSFNAPGAELETVEAQSTNPMAGEVAFTGTDGGEPSGSWGTSRIDLSKIDAAAGDELRFRFDFGRDGCNGVDGWYVDNVQVTVCKVASTVTATHAPEPSTYGEPHSLNVTVAGTSPSGAVTVTEGATVVGTGAVTNGASTVALPADLPAGTHALTVTYTGDGTNASGSTTTSIKVDKVTSKTSASSPNKVKVGKAVAVKVKVKLPGSSVDPTGKVVVELKGQKVASSKLGKNGTVTLKVKKLKIGKQTLKVTYQGTGNIEDSADKVTVRITRR